MGSKVDAPIVPGRTLGGIEVGSSVRQYADELLRADLRGGVSYRLRGIFEAIYTLENGAIEFAVDVRNGKIARVTATQGYTGLLDGVIQVGMTVGEAMAVDDTFYYDEPSELILRRETPGLSLEVAERDPLPEVVPALRIRAVTVFHPILDTKAGQTGDW